MTKARGSQGRNRRALCYAMLGFGGGPPWALSCQGRYEEYTAMVEKVCTGERPMAAEIGLPTSSAPPAVGARFRVE